MRNTDFMWSVHRDFGHSLCREISSPDRMCSQQALPPDLSVIITAFFDRSIIVIRACNNKYRLSLHGTRRRLKAIPHSWPISQFKIIPLFPFHRHIGLFFLVGLHRGKVLAHYYLPYRALYTVYSIYRIYIYILCYKAYLPESERVHFSNVPWPF